MKPYIQKLVDMKLLSHKGGLALEVGAGSGEDAKTFGDLGYLVEAFDKKEGKDLRDFTFEQKKYDFINCNNVLPFLHDKEEVSSALHSMAQSLKKGGVLRFSLFGENDPWKSVYSDKMSFYTFREANDLIDSLPLKCVLRSSEEYMGKTMAGADKYWHMLQFILVAQ